MRRLPSLRGLQAFEAVARTGTVGPAADTLGITPSAVSHRIRGLEKELAVQLFERTANGLALTEAGRQYRVAVEAAFTLLARSTADLVGPDLSRPLMVSLTESIGARWLMPRFHRFTAQHPNIDVAVLRTSRLANLLAGEADLALRYGEGLWPGLRAEPVLRFAVSPLCAPRLMEEICGLPPAEAVAKCTLIRAAYDDWEIWLGAAGAIGAKPERQLRVTDFSMAVTAAINGQGIILGYSGFVEAEIAAGVLVQPFKLTVPVRKGYHLVYAGERLTDPRVRAFRDWVISESTPAHSQQTGFP